MKTLAWSLVVSVVALLPTSAAQAKEMNPPYLSEMPSVERVQSEIQGDDPMNTAARQMGAFWQLQQVVNDMAGPRRYRNQLTPDEGRLLGQYSAGYQSAAQPYAEIQKTPSHPDRLKWYQMHTLYENDPEFLDGLLQRFCSAQFRTQYYQTTGKQPPQADVQTGPPPAYLREMPSVERVMSEIQGSDPADTAVKQIGAFMQIIKLMPMVRDVTGRLTPAEKKLIADYKAAYARIWESRPELKSKSSVAPTDLGLVWSPLRGYDVDKQFREELLQRLFSPALRDQYAKAMAEEEAQKRAKDAAREKAWKEQDAKREAALKELIEQTRPPEWKRRLARCIASGRSESECFAEELGKGVGEILPIAKNKPKPAGLSMSGVYAAESGCSVTFGPGGAWVACKAVSAQANYRIEREGNQVHIRLVQPSAADMLGFGSEVLEKLMPKTGNANPNEWQGQQIVFTVRSDGKLAGPGTIQVTGSVPVGTRQGTRTITETQGGFTTTRTEPTTETIYEARTESCQLGVLTATDKMPLIGPSMSTIMATVLELVSGNTDPGAAVKVPAPGLRMNGQYVGEAGFDIEFHADSAVVECRDALVAREYSVAIKGDQILVTIRHEPNPVVLELKPDGTLAGSGTIPVNGRVFVGSKERVENALVIRDPVFQPVTDTCACGALKPAQPAP
jgi:hypothetical protein